MSLINKVLKDLDKRKQQENGQQSPAQGLKPRYVQRIAWPWFSKKTVLIMIIILAAIAMAVGLFWHWGSSSSTKLNLDSESVKSTQNKTSSEQTNQKQNNKTSQQANQQQNDAKSKQHEEQGTEQQSKQNPDQQQAQQKNDKQQNNNQNQANSEDNDQAQNQAEIVSAHIDVGKQHVTNVVLGLSKAVKYRIDHQQSDAGQTIVLHLFATHSKQLNLQLPATLSALKKIQQDDSEQGEYILRFKLHSGAKLRSVNMDKQSQPVQLALAFVLPDKERQKIKESVMAVTRAQKRHKRIQKAKKAYKQALKPLKQGEYSEARHRLTKVVHQAPSYLKARVTLVKLLLKRNELQQAYQYLKHALAKRPDDVQLIMLKARYYYQQNLIEQALDTLEGIDPPSLQEHPQYYAFTAAIQRQLNHDKIAIQLYKQLLSYAPDRSLWWLGLGLAYEDAGQSNDAQKAYQKALDTGGLNPNLNAYVASKLE